jgi:hypothetical protein
LHASPGPASGGGPDTTVIVALSMIGTWTSRAFQVIRLNVPVTLTIAPISGSGWAASIAVT